MTDFLLLENLHEIISRKSRQRVAFEKGICTEGIFYPYISFEKYTKAEIFRKPGAQTRILARFSSMMGDWGTADTVRNIKGLTVKFRTDEGDYDMICHSLPVFFTDRWEKLPELIEAMSKQNLFSGLDRKKFWKFAIENRESINCVIRFFSRYGLASSFLNMSWYTAGTYVWINHSGEKYIVRYRWVPVNAKDTVYSSSDSRNRKMDRMLAEFMAGFDPDAAVDELCEAVSGSEYPVYELQVQIAEYRYISHPDYLKRTLCWNDKIFPPVPVGVIRLDSLKGSESHENIEFAPGNLIPGIGLCDDEFSAVSDYLYKVCMMEK